MESIGKTIINIKNDASDEEKKQIAFIFNDIYGDSKYIKKVNNNYQGDMGCLCVLGTRIVRHLIKNNLLSLITCYNVININTNEKENLLEDE